MIERLKISTVCTYLVAGAVDDPFLSLVGTLDVPALVRVSMGEHICLRPNQDVLEHDRAHPDGEVKEEAHVGESRPGKDEVVVDLVVHDVVGEDSKTALEEEDNHQEKLGREDGILHYRETLEARRRARRRPEDRVAERPEDEDEAYDVVPGRRPASSSSRLDNPRPGGFEKHDGDHVEAEDLLPAWPVIPKRTAEQQELDETFDA